MNRGLIIRRAQCPGVLDDGTAGLWAIKDRGGVALVQSPESAEFDSMPQSAIDHVAVDRIGSLAELGAEIVRRLDQTSRPGAADASEASKRMTIEPEIAMEGNGLQAGVMELGVVSRFTCPDCSGVLVELHDGPILRFRCHTGHAFSLKTLLVEVNESIDQALWTALRAVAERIMLLRSMERVALDSGKDDLARGSDQQTASA